MLNRPTRQTFHWAIDTKCGLRNRYKCSLVHNCCNLYRKIKQQQFWNITDNSCTGRSCRSPQFVCTVPTQYFTLDKTAFFRNCWAQSKHVTASVFSCSGADFSLTWTAVIINSVIVILWATMRSDICHRFVCLGKQLSSASTQCVRRLRIDLQSPACLSRAASVSWWVAMHYQYHCHFGLTNRLSFQFSRIFLVDVN
jgi:hypothetical protein